MSKIRYQTICRRCHKEVSVPFPPESVENDSNGRHLRCTCGRTNYARKENAELVA